MSMRNVLHQIYINLWVEYGTLHVICWREFFLTYLGIAFADGCHVVVKNPLSPAEHKGGEGVKNELFELGLDQFIRGLM